MVRNDRLLISAVTAFIVLSLLIYSCAGTRYYSEEDLGIRSETLYDEQTTVPAHGEPLQKEPGESTRIERSFENSPPLIPHDTTGMLPLEQTDNVCLECHMHGEAEDAGAVPLPQSHFVDLDTGQDLGITLDGKRYNCMQCHVIQTTLTPPIENLFKGVFRDEGGRYGSNLLSIINEGVQAE